MFRTKTGAAVTALATVLAASLFAPISASADSLQSSKNSWRNITIGSAVVAGLGLLSHNSAETVLGVAGAAIAGSQYEQDRHIQSVEQNDYGYGNYGNGQGYTNYGNGNYWNQRDGYLNHWNRSENVDNRNWNQNDNRNEQETATTDGDNEAVCKKISAGSAHDPALISLNEPPANHDVRRACRMY